MSNFAPGRTYFRRTVERVRCWPGWWRYLTGLALHGQWRDLWTECAPGWWLDRR